MSKSDRRKASNEEQPEPEALSSAFLPDDARIFGALDDMFVDGSPSETPRRIPVAVGQRIRLRGWAID